MVNLIAGRAVVPELMQSQMTGSASPPRRCGCLRSRCARPDEGRLAEVRARLSGVEDAPHRAAAIVQEILEGQLAHVS